MQKLNCLTGVDLWMTNHSDVKSVLVHIHDRYPDKNIKAAAKLSQRPKKSLQVKQFRSYHLKISVLEEKSFITEDIDGVKVFWRDWGAKKDLGILKWRWTS